MTSRSEPRGNASVILRYVEASGLEREAAVRWVEKAASIASGTVLGSKLVRAECLVMPFRTRDQALVDKSAALFRDSGIVLVDISGEILELATHVFADHRIKMADAIHTATAILGNCDPLIAKDETVGQEGTG